jgi:hypothetical protein
MRKRAIIEQMIQAFLYQICNFAEQGKTSYLCDLHSHVIEKDGVMRSTASMSSPVLTIDDLITGFQRKFPDCKVTYEEFWVEINSHTGARILKKGILIDWS